MNLGLFLYDQFDAENTKRLLLIDDESFETKYSFSGLFKDNGFTVLYYTDDLNYRINQEDIVKHDKNQILIIAKPNCYIPYDLLTLCAVHHITYEDLFHGLNSKIVRNTIKNKTQLDLLCLSIYDEPTPQLGETQTESFFKEKVFGTDNVYKYIKSLISQIELLEHNNDCKEWHIIAKNLAEITLLAYEYGLSENYFEVINKLFTIYNNKFQKYILENYSLLYSYVSSSSPVLVNRTLEYISEKSKKFALIVMDGMGFFDWKVLSKTFNNIKYEESFAFAMLPTITSISRQCLLSGKYPKDLKKNMLSMANEEKEFLNCAINKLYYKEYQIQYERKYNPEIKFTTKCLAIVINVIDDLVHNVINRKMMYNSLLELNKSNKLYDTIKSLLKQNFDVYITADHGNTECKGIGKFTKSGVETASKSKRMLILKDYANINEIINKFNLIEIPKDYLPKNLNYYVCQNETAFENINTKLMSHGGISIDEVIVPFIIIKASENND